VCPAFGIDTHEELSNKGELQEKKVRVVFLLRFKLAGELNKIFTQFMFYCKLNATHFITESQNKNRKRTRIAFFSIHRTVINLDTNKNKQNLGRIVKIIRILKSSAT